MKSTLLFVLDALGSVMTFYGGAFVLTLSRPKAFYDWFASKGEAKQGIRAAPGYAWALFQVISVGLFLYYAAYGIFDVIPRDWLEYNEDGEVVTSTRNYLQIAFAVFGTAFALDGATKASAEGKRLAETERQKYGY